MSYSDDRSSGGGAAGAAGIIGTVLLVCIVVGLKIAARTASRTLARTDFSQHEPPPGDPNFYSRDGARQTSIVAPPVPVNPGYQPTPSYTPPPVPLTPEQLAAQQEEERQRREKALADTAEQDRQRREGVPTSADPAPPRPATEPPDSDLDRQRRERELSNSDDDRERREKALADAERARLAEAARPAPQPQPGGNNDAPPGFVVTSVDQVKPKEMVFARDQSGWFPAVVLHRRGAEVTIRYTTNGVVDRVAVGRIRLQTEPGTNVAANDPPAALRPVAAPRDPASKPETADDSLIVAKPRKDEVATEQPAVAAPPVAGPAAKGPAPTFRTWSNSTGEFKVDAELLSFEFDLVQLKKRDGKVISIRLDALSADDQAFVRERYK